MLGAIPADAEIDGIVFGVIVGPNLLARAFPALGNGIANENDLRFIPEFGDLAVEAFVAVFPPLIPPAGRE